MLIREADTEDLMSIVELWKEFMDFHSKLNPAYIRSDNGHDEFYKLVLEKSSDPDWKIFVAETNKEIVGYCVGGIEKLPPVFKLQEYGYIQDIAVTTILRNKGIGKKLFHEILRWFESKNITRVELNLLANNIDTEKFWSSLGFRIFTTRMFKNLK